MVVITIKGEEVNLGYYLAMQTAVGLANLIVIKFENRTLNSLHNPLSRRRRGNPR